MGVISNSRGYRNRVELQGTIVKFECFGPPHSPHPYKRRPIVQILLSALWLFPVKRRLAVGWVEPAQGV